MVPMDRAPPNPSSWISAHGGVPEGDAQVDPARPTRRPPRLGRVSPAS